MSIYEDDDDFEPGEDDTELDFSGLEDDEPLSLDDAEDLSEED
jgi:hypothetical protein